ncbi:MAG TPA: A24 family peptidase C-terminal domain-containing protein [Thermoplasmata archaeon]
MDSFAAARLALATGGLLFAAIADVRTRRVRDPLWVLLGTAGLVLLAIETYDDRQLFERYAMLAAMAILFYAIFYGRPLFEEDGFHARPLRVGVFAAAGLLVLGAWVLARDAGPSETDVFLRLLVPLLLILLYQGMHQIGLLHGGADTKALIALALLVPAAPNASPFPILVVPLDFPFSFVALINAAILFLAIPVAYLIANAIRGDLKFPMALFGTRADIDRLPAHAWLMEKIDAKGQHVAILFPRRGGDRQAEIEKLRAAGVRRVWVQPQVPFMVPLLAGFLLAFFVGNLLSAFLGAILPRP